MSARGGKKPARPDISVVLERDGAAADTRRRFFAIDGITITIEADRPDRESSAAELAARLHAVCSIPPAPARIEAWGPGQFDRTTLGPGIEAWLRVTPAGRVRLVIPGGDLDITAGAGGLGTGINEACVMAARIRGQIIDRGHARAAKLGHDSVCDSIQMAFACRRCDRTGAIGADGKRRGALFTQRCA